MEIVDTHIHTYFSKDCTFEPTEQIAAAEQSEISVIALTDHAEVNNFDVRAAKRIKDAATHIPRMVRFRADDGGIGNGSDRATLVTHGIEIAQQNADPELAASIIKAGNYDFVLGSLHSTRYAEKLPGNAKYNWAEPEPGDMFFVDYEHISEEQIHTLVDEYIDIAGEIAETADFDSFAHFGYVARYIYEARKVRYDLLEHKSKVKRVLEALISRDKCLEINTAKIGQRYNRLVPDINVIKLYYDLGGRYVTTGSDAHAPTKIGNGIGYAYTALRGIGFTEVSYYLKRNRNVASIC